MGWSIALQKNKLTLLLWSYEFSQFTGYEDASSPHAQPQKLG